MGLYNTQDILQEIYNRKIECKFNFGKEDFILTVLGKTISIDSPYSLSFMMFKGK